MLTFFKKTYNIKRCVNFTSHIFMITISSLRKDIACNSLKIIIWKMKTREMIYLIRSYNAFTSH